MEQQRKQFEAARAAAAQQQQMQQNGAAGTNTNQQQRLPNGQPSAQMQSANGQQAPQMPNGQYPQQGTSVNGQQQYSQQQLQQQQAQRQQQMPAATRNGHLAVPPVNGQSMAAQAQMRTPSMNGQVPDPAQMQRYAQAHAQRQQQQQQFAGQQAYGAMQSPNGGVGMSAQQTMQSSQAMMAANMKAQMNQAQQPGSNTSQAPGMSPSMPPPPTPQQNANVGALSSGHTPVLMSVRAKFKSQYPQYSDEQILQLATKWLAEQSQSASASTQARQSAMNAAAGINHVGSANNMQAYGYNQNMAYQNMGGQMAGNGYGTDGMNAQGGGMSPQQYANFLRQGQAAQLRNQQLQGSPAGSHASLNMSGSPSMANASPNTASMTPVSPNMQYTQMSGMNMGGMQQRPPSRSATGTPQQRPGSAVGVPNMGQGMGSPGSASGMMQGSPGRVQASMAR